MRWLWIVFDLAWGGIEGSPLLAERWAWKGHRRIKFRDMIRAPAIYNHNKARLEALRAEYASYRLADAASEEAVAEDLRSEEAGVEACAEIVRDHPYPPDRYYSEIQNVATASAHAIGILLDAEPHSPGTPKLPPEDGEEESQPPPLTKTQRRTLLTLARFDSAVLVSAEEVVEEMDPEERLSERTVRPAINRLVELLLAERPQGDKHGVRLTLLGRRLASKIAD